MTSYQNKRFSDNHPSASLSFDDPQRNDVSHHSIDHYPRLKTNQSIEQRPLGSIQMRKDSKKPIKTQESELDVEHCRRLATEQYDLRIESLVKQYQLRLNKQEEFHGLKEWKMKQELENLQKQNHSLTQELRRVKNSNRQVQKQCPLCCDGQIINQLTKVLAQNEQNHKGCISEKKQLRSKAIDATTKLEVLQQQHQKTCQQMRSLGKQIKTFQSKIKQLEQERDYKIHSVAKTDKIWQQKMSNAGIQSKVRQRQIAQINMQLNQSKATVQSTKSAFTNKHSLKSSYAKMQDSNIQQNRRNIKQSYQYSRDPRQQKQNQMVQGRVSQNKIMKISSDDYKQNQNISYLKKMSQNLPRNTLLQRYEPIRRKYF